MEINAMMDPQTLIIAAALAGSFLLGCITRLIRNLGRQRFDIADAGADLRELLERWDQQQVQVRDMRSELEGLRQSLARAGQSSAPSGNGALTLDPCKLARSGASVETLMARCRLSRPEAELVLSVHGTQSKAA